MAANSLAKDRKTPGVYITEFPAFPPSIVGVATAIPIFIGYTEKAVDPASRKSVYMQSVSISSMNDFVSIFGRGCNAAYVVGDPKSNQTSYDFIANGKNYVVRAAANDQDIRPIFNLYLAMQLFYANGGGECFVVSVGNYWGESDVKPHPEKKPGLDNKPVLVVLYSLLRALKDVASDVRGPTMIVIPDACLLDPGQYKELTVEMLQQASALQDRVAILDLPGIVDPLGTGGSWNKAGLRNRRKAFYEALAGAQDVFSYGAAYGPALRTTILTPSEIDFRNLRGSKASCDMIKHLLREEAKSLYTAPEQEEQHTLLQEAINQAFVAPGEPGSADLKNYKPLPANASADDRETYYLSLDNLLTAALPLYKQMQKILLDKLNVAPPSGAIAGLWSRNDSNRGVWNAPANMSLAGVVAPTVLLSDKDQGDYNVPLNGQAINIVRAFPGRGAVVWGARTLDGNSLDYRYIQVRRTLIFIEQSIKIALQGFVFAPNDANTWSVVTASIANFLTNLWQAGGLMGAKPTEAFSVQCGLGSTMTGLDILNGYMIVSVTLQMVHPAEFIELTFKQTMQGV